MVTLAEIGDEEHIAGAKEHDLGVRDTDINDWTSREKCTRRS